jgi:hypothetical protein
VVLVNLECEIDGASSWVARHGCALEFDTSTLTITFDLDHPADKTRLRLVANCDDYKAVPPAWKFVDLETGASTKTAWPSPGTLPDGISSILHTSPVICAPFNRLAYAEHGGPHADWSASTNWLNLTGPHIRASTIGEMLAAIHLHVSRSPGRMS